MSRFQKFAAHAAEKKTRFWNRASRGFNELINLN